jgi:hypothetical protein
VFRDSHPGYQPAVLPGRCRRCCASRPGGQLAAVLGDQHLDRLRFAYVGGNKRCVQAARHLRARAVLEIYINLDDREMIGRSFTEMAAASIWASRFQEATKTARRGLTYLQGEVSADRARLFATLAQTLAAAGIYQPADKALREALNTASQLSDSKLEAGLLSIRSIIDIQFFRLRETVTDAPLSKQVDGSDLPPWLFVLQLLILHQVFTLSWAPGRGGENRGRA